MSDRRIAILGAGRLGESMLRGFLSSGWREPGEVVVTSRRAERRDALAALYGVEATADNAAAIGGARLVILSVKPQDVVRVLAEIAPSVSPEQTLLSVAAGRDDRPRSSRGCPKERASSVRCRTRRRWCTRGSRGSAAATTRATRTSTSRPPRSGISAPSSASPRTTWTRSPRSAAPGPAYFALLAEAMIEAGLLLGLSRDVSTRLVVQTMFGSARLLRDENMHPVELREAVTSPGGTTTRAIRELERLRRPRRVPERDQRGDRAVARARRAACLPRPRGCRSARFVRQRGPMTTGVGSDCGRRCALCARRSNGLRLAERADRQFA